VLPIDFADAPDWHDLADRALNLSDEALTRPTVDVEEETAGVDEPTDGSPIDQSAPSSQTIPLAVIPIVELAAEGSH
ncbi:MAG TPA: hypothetical protein VKB09_12730, partial [Thermomicrobiales bacterium]|nr:hypothetical protein [Thermomicrobiales bacterium]